MPYIPGVHLLPATGEFTYDTEPYSGKRASEPSLSAINTYFSPGGSKTDYSYALNQLQATHPECGAVSVVCAWFCDGLTAGDCNIYPSTTYLGGSFQNFSGAGDVWRCSGLTQNSPGLIPIPTANGSFIYGGTPSDQSIVRCISDLKSRGLKVIFYPFLLLTANGLPWRGRISYSPDLSSAATSAVSAFLGNATTAQFTRDSVNLTVSYSGAATDWTYRRMILHYANLCLVAGGVNLFVIGSEFRGLETIRGPAWTAAGTTDGSGNAIWDYPFVAGLEQIASEVRTAFDGAGFPKNMSALQNLITYSADWSNWMGYQHPGANGQWPHLDSLFASPNIDFVSFDNYLPLSDWTTSSSGLDKLNWSSETPTSWPVASPSYAGLGMSGSPTLYSKPYLKANIEGGEHFNWYYADSANGGVGLDPRGSGQFVTLPEGDRVAQLREPYQANQQILANKQLRWWWNQSHYAVYDNGDGTGWSPHGPQTGWIPHSKPILFLEYGAPSVDKATNQPNVFFNPNSTESKTAYWSCWDSAPNQALRPRRDDTLSSLALDSIYEYWNADGNNATVGGVVMIQFAFCCAWNWDARPFPTFPLMSNIWGDCSQWSWGNWLNGKSSSSTSPPGSPDPTPGTYPSFPNLASLGWSTHVRSKFATVISRRASGREIRAAARAYATYDIELTLDVLQADTTSLALQQIAGFYLSQGGADALFWLAPPGLAELTGQLLGTGDGARTVFPLVCDWATGNSEPILATTGVGAVYLNGALQSVGWSASPGYAPAILFAEPPPSGVAVTADFGPLWLCRFAEDVADFENFMTLLWRFAMVKVQTVRP